MATLVREHEDFGAYAPLQRWMRTTHARLLRGRPHTQLVLLHAGVSAAHQQRLISEHPGANVELRDVRVIKAEEGTRDSGGPFEVPPWVRMPLRPITEDRSLGYRHMCRFWSLLWPQALRDFDYVMRLDDDVELVEDVVDDPFEAMIRDDLVYAWSTEAQEGHGPTLRTLVPWADEDMAKQRARGSLPCGAAAAPGGAFQAANVSTIVFTNVFIARRAFFEVAQVRDFLHRVDETGNFFYQRWGDAPVHTLVVQAYAPRTASSCVPMAYRHASTGNVVSGCTMHDAPSEQTNRDQALRAFGNVLLSRYAAAALRNTTRSEALAMPLGGAVAALKEALVEHLVIVGEEADDTSAREYLSQFSADELARLATMWLRCADGNDDTHARGCQSGVSAAMMDLAALARAVHSEDDPDAARLVLAEEVALRMGAPAEAVRRWPWRSLLQALGLWALAVDGVDVTGDAKRLHLDDGDASGATVRGDDGKEFRNSLISVMLDALGVDDTELERLQTLSTAALRGVATRLMERAEVHVRHPALLRAAPHRYEGAPAGVFCSIGGKVVPCESYGYSRDAPSHLRSCGAMAGEEGLGFGAWLGAGLSTAYEAYLRDQKFVGPQTAAWQLDGYVRPLLATLIAGGADAWGGGSADSQRNAHLRKSVDRLWPSARGRWGNAQNEMRAMYEFRDDVLDRFLGAGILPPREELSEASWERVRDLCANAVRASLTVSRLAVADAVQHGRPLSPQNSVHPCRGLWEAQNKGIPCAAEAAAQDVRERARAHENTLACDPASVIDEAQWVIRQAWNAGDTLATALGVHTVL